MTRPHVFAIAWVAYATLVVLSPAEAHHSPSHVVEALTERIESEAATASLLVRRGDEYCAISQSQLAIADYESALKLQSDYLPALYGFAQVSYRQQCFGNSIKACQQGIAVAPNADEAAPFHDLLARIYEQQQQWEDALEEWKHSLDSSHPNINWYLGESRTLTQLHRPDDARLALEAAMERNPSIVLHRAWIKTLIDCGKTNEASLHIEKGLARSRWKSSWLLLRARLHLSQDQAEAAKQDAELVLREIEARWNPNVTNPLLIASQEQALAILARE